MRPDAVLAYKVDPSAAYQTRSTAPVASDGRARSIAEFPTRRQVPCPHTHQGNAAARHATETARTVALRHIERVYCILSAFCVPRNKLNLYSFVEKNPI